MSRKIFHFTLNTFFKIKYYFQQCLNVYSNKRQCRVWSTVLLAPWDRISSTTMKIVTLLLFFFWTKMEVIIPAKSCYAMNLLSRQFGEQLFLYWLLNNLQLGRIIYFFARIREVLKPKSKIFVLEQFFFVCSLTTFAYWRMFLIFLTEFILLPSKISSTGSFAKLIGQPLKIWVTVSSSAHETIELCCQIL